MGLIETCGLGYRVASYSLSLLIAKDQTSSWFDSISRTREVAKVSNVLLDKAALDLAAIQRMLFEESKHEWCWCTNQLSLCGTYSPGPCEIVVYDDWEPDCQDCAKTTHCPYCRCEIGNVTCETCLRNYREWLADNPC